MFKNERKTFRKKKRGLVDASSKRLLSRGNGMQPFLGWCLRNKTRFNTRYFFTALKRRRFSQEGNVIRSHFLHDFLSQEEMVLRSLREFVDHCMERLVHSSWPSAGDDFQSTLELEETQHILR